MSHLEANVTVYLDADELYPYYILNTERRYLEKAIQLTPTEWKDYQRVRDEFVAWQRKLDEKDTEQ